MAWCGNRWQLERHKKVYGHREGRGEKREEKRSHFRAIVGSYGPLPNEVLKGCLGTTSKTIGSYPVSSSKSWIQVGEVVRYLDPCFLPGPAWKQFNPVEISGWRITWTFCAHPPWSLNAQLTQKIRTQWITKIFVNFFCKFISDDDVNVLFMLSSNCLWRGEVLFRSMHAWLQKIGEGFVQNLQLFDDKFSHFWCILVSCTSR